ncbi:hypothetical protein FIBSPDRAFT_338837 [Athelia psychrophila]|uniref:Uncharacterized protein n=1 Tax=Athelia psychrophila TaxID=1759441 RepID=A0A167W9R2_9AGAM|nr:hypothetical protein FIBSPDRAFT_338837 [Fibularhizoctonia sp. CBS 109695]
MRAGATGTRAARRSHTTTPISRAADGPTRADRADHPHRLHLPTQGRVHFAQHSLIRRRALTARQERKLLGAQHIPPLCCHRHVPLLAHYPPLPPSLSNGSSSEIQKTGQYRDGACTISGGVS